MSLQKALALSAFDDDEVVLEVDDDVDDWLLASDTPQLKSRRFASLTYDAHVRVVSHSREPVSAEVAFWQIKSSSQTSRFPSKHPSPAVDGVEVDVCAANTSSGFMSHLYLTNVCIFVTSLPLGNNVCHPDFTAFRAHKVLNEKTSILIFFGYQESNVIGDSYK